MRETIIAIHCLAENFIDSPNPNIILKVSYLHISLICHSTPHARLDIKNNGRDSRRSSGFKISVCDMEKSGFHHKKHRSSFDSDCLQLPDGPVKICIDSQCVISPPLQGNLSMLLRSDDVCVASVTYFLKDSAVMSMANIRDIASIMKDEELTNQQAVQQIRNLINELGDESLGLIRFILTLFILNTLDPASQVKKELEIIRDSIKREVSNYKKWSRSGPRSSFLHKLSSKGARRFSTGKKSTVSIGKHTLSATRSRTKREVEALDEKRTMKLGSLTMAVPRREIERIPIELRRSGSVVEHALKLKAESTEVAEGVALLRMMSLSHPDAIFEADRLWEEELSKEGQSTPSKGKKKKRTRRSLLIALRVKSKKRYKQQASESDSTELTEEADLWLMFDLADAIHIIYTKIKICTVDKNVPMTAVAVVSGVSEDTAMWIAFGPGKEIVWCSIMICHLRDRLVQYHDVTSSQRSSGAVSCYIISETVWCSIMICHLRDRLVQYHDATSSQRSSGAVS
ncbi:hypothetical protein RRG08_003125 [Elysia crispata]|uniref:Uncharacterized protein n=1 Tax=Elysia crispata TaxID=231223 RepID=A0AAE1B703_9GAST|nr:hypothetical protein RRG08_003125 [Elysia crispata]